MGSDELYMIIIVKLEMFLFCRILSRLNETVCPHVHFQEQPSRYFPVEQLAIFITLEHIPHRRLLGMIFRLIRYWLQLASVENMPASRSSS